MDYIFDHEKYEISDKELTKLVRDNYTAMLLVCNPESGEPKTFYSVKGSLGGELTPDEEAKLIWKVERITDTRLSLATSAFTIAGASSIYEYVFDNNGILLSQEKTGEVVDFMR